VLDTYIKFNLACKLKMDPRVREVIEGAMGSCNSDLSSLEPQIDAKMNSVLESCFAKNASSPDRFADCIVDKNRQVD
jgi:hypothetical protein